MKLRRFMTALALAALVVLVFANAAHAATGDFDPSASWSDWFYHYAGVAIQTVYGWFGYCMPDITGQHCAIP